MSHNVTQLGLDELEDVLRLFDAVQLWLIRKGLKAQWGDAPFSESEVQRERFREWLEAGRMVGVRLEGQVVGTLVFSLSPPEYAREAMRRWVKGGYLEAFAVARDYAGQGVGAALLGWAENEARGRGWLNLYLDCWAGNAALRTYYRHSEFSEVALLAVGAWQGVLFRKTLKGALSLPATSPAKT